MLHEAMGFTGMTLSEFVAYAVQEKAQQVIDAEGPIVLTEGDCRQILEWMENPPPRNARFLEAEARYRRLIKNADSTT